MTSQPRRRFPTEKLSFALVFLGIFAAGFFLEAQCPDPEVASCPPGFYMAEIDTGSEPLLEGNPIEVSISGVTGSSPAEFLTSTVEVDGDSVRINSWFELGPWATPDFWEEEFDLPPLEKGAYSLEFRIWDESSQGMVLNSETSFQVQSAAAVPALSVFGVALLGGFLAFAGLRLLRTWSH